MNHLSAPMNRKLLWMGIILVLLVLAVKAMADADTCLFHWDATGLHDCAGNLLLP